MFDSPGVLWVYNKEAADVTWYNPRLDIDKIVKFANTDPATVAAWQSGDTVDAMSDVVQELSYNLDKYVGTATASSTHLAGGSYGSAWVVSSNGYLVTNHHVTLPEDSADWVSQLTASSANGDVAQPVLNVGQSLISQLQKGLAFNGKTVALSDSDSSTMLQTADSWVTDTSKVSAVTEQLNVGGGQNIDTSNGGLSAQVVSTTARTWPYADVAILKVNATDLPVVPLGDDTTLQTGDPVYALGYPASASFESGTSMSATVTATQSTGQVTNRLQSQDGTFSVIETDAPFNHGSSGGPLVDADGQVVGMDTAVDVSTDANSGGDNGNKLNYAMPVSMIKQDLRRAGVVQLVSPDQLLYDKGMLLMEHDHYVAALSDVEKAETDGFSTPYVVAHVKMMQAAIADGQNVPLESGPPKWLWALVAVVGALLAGGTLGLIRVLRRRRRDGTATAEAIVSPVGSTFPTIPGPPDFSATTVWNGPFGNAQDWGPPTSIEAEMNGTSFT